MIKLKEIIKGVSELEDEASNIDLDERHLQTNTECGYLPEKPKNLPISSRISNAEEANVHYPWVIKVIRENLEFPDWKKTTNCGLGSSSCTHTSNPTQSINNWFHNL